jgi:hypothetical protein
LDYKKIILYLIIILAALGYWYKTELDEAARTERALTFASVYAGTSVIAELYRNEPDRFIQARDSIYETYNFNADSIDKFKQSFEGREGEWVDIWNIVRTKTDSLIEYFKASPIENSSDSTDNVMDSTISSDDN